MLAGHGLGLDKRHVFGIDALLGRVDAHAIAVAAFDAPGHGERREGEPYGAQWARTGGSEIARELGAAVAELRAPARLGPVPLGFWGLSLATQYGLAFLAEASDVRGAVLGLFRGGPRVVAYARRVRCPVFFVRQEHDEIHSAASVEALFAALASAEKRLVTSPGRHQEVPPHVLAEAAEFLRCKLQERAR